MTSPSPGHARTAGPLGHAHGSPGVVLLVMVLFLALLALSIAAGARLTMDVSMLSESRADLVRAELAAEAAVRSAAYAWRATDGPALALLEERPLGPPLLLDGGATGQATAKRLGGDAYLLSAEGRAGRVRARAAALVRVFSVRSFLPAFPAALTANALRPGDDARIGVMAPAAAPPPWTPDVCDPGALDTLDAVFGPDPRPAFAHEPPGMAATGLGPIPWSSLAAWADRVESGSVRPAPVARDGTCDRAAAENWGAPGDLLSPCAGYFPLIVADGDLRVTGGSGQGVLVVRGDLVLEGGANFYGPVLVGGTARAEAGTAVWGAVHAREAQWEGTLSYSACALLRALEASPGLARPMRAGGRFWIPIPGTGKKL